MTDKQENAGQHVADPQPEPSHREPTLLEKLGVKEGSTAQGLVEIVGESLRCWYLGSPRAHGDLCSHRSRLHWRLCGLSVQGGFIAITANPYGANGTSNSTSARGGSMTESARSEDSMGGASAIKCWWLPRNPLVC